MIACEQFDTFELYGTQVFAVPDLVYRSQLERYLIVDWKQDAKKNRTWNRWLCTVCMPMPNWELTRKRLWSAWNTSMLVQLSSLR